MKGYLRENQIEYVLFHLGMHFHLTTEIRKYFRFQKDDKADQDNPGIVFDLCTEEYNLEKVFTIEDTPVLFSKSSATSVFTIKGGSVIFNFDILKSAFYLLSGYQEISMEEGNGRFLFSNSIQKDLNIITKPIVNRYFEWIIGGLETFCKNQGITIERKTIFSSPRFFLSHDIDIVDTYTFSEAGYRWKQFFGLAPRLVSFRRTGKIAIKYLFNYLCFIKRPNPFWSFSLMQELEDKNDFKSTYYMLPYEQKHVDAYYRFTDKRISRLIASLIKSGNEIGLHGTVNSAFSLDSMKSGLETLGEVSGAEIKGIRQHRLTYNKNSTPHIQESVGLSYDASLGYAEHEGFRNSYCHPFRLYDHKADRMMDLWEIPLNIMDVTLFLFYRDLDFKQAEEAIMNLAKEVVRYNGVLSLLWHNSHFDEDIIPGITDFYARLLQKIKHLGFKSGTGNSIIEELRSEGS